MKPYSSMTLLGLALALAQPQASASSLAGTVTLGGTYSGTLQMRVNGNTTSQGEGGGNIGGSSAVIGGHSLAFSQFYCVDLFTNASLNATYNASFNTDGLINGNAVTNAGQVAWLLTHIGPTATTQPQFQALQGLIWHLENGNNAIFDQIGNSAAAVGYYNQYVSALGNHTAPVNSVIWINPLNSSGHYGYQGFAAVPSTTTVAALFNVPVPATVYLLGAGLMGWTFGQRRPVRHPLSA
ncbi:PEP-CTERM protein-sorting domain-containing protein [Methylomagnum ishizawai]|uniref:PEP-CTERM protein-sorting domain-containing protein n=1 Tax=Methylomagnum ishizawai TaxID=1760988 RepID=A0A1Y6CZL9_9GAMM|nr:PEP-CTERM sorting domain-containing protein [Methylomagnum ishizawai]SMF95827.1 PEP-CTERM protein-sorting domain-containing protein [Methylomagnum ishizawai]